MGADPATIDKDQRYIVPKVECRLRPFWLNMAATPAITPARPTKTWNPTSVRKNGETEGISMPATMVVFAGTRSDTSERTSILQDLGKLGRDQAQRQSYELRHTIYCGCAMRRER